MPVTYKNRKEVTYTLCQGITKTGKSRYYFSPNPKDPVLDAIPEGYEICENVNGQVSLGKIRPQLITPDELSIVQQVITQHPKAKNYRADIKGKYILVYENAGPDMDVIIEMFQSQMPLPPSRVEAFRQEEEKFQRFSPFLRFELIDKENRLFQAERETYTGRGGWRRMGHQGTLEELAGEIISLLDTDEFFVYF